MQNRFPCINIIHVILELNIGGAEGMLARLVESHHSNPRYKHIVVSLMDMGPIGLQLSGQKVDVYALGMKSALDLPRVLFQLVRLISNLKPNIVQTWMYHANLLGGLAAMLVGNQHLIWSVRRTGLPERYWTRVVSWLCSCLSYRMPQMIVCSANASRESHIAFGYDATKMIVVPNGYNFACLRASADERQSLREQCGIKPNELVIGSLGRFHVAKDHATFLRAAGMLARHYSQLRFLLVGHGLDWENKELVALLQMTGCKSRFILLGLRKDVPQCLAAMDIFCLHSKTEGFPNALAEAMAMGLPCVTTDVGDASMLVSDTGVVVPKENPAGLAGGIEQLLAIPLEARQLLGQKAKARVRAEFSMAVCTERFEAVYQNLAAGDYG